MRGIDEIMAEHEKRADEIFREAHERLDLVSKRIGRFCFGSLLLGILLIGASVWIRG